MLKFGAKGPSPVGTERFNASHCLAGARALRRRQRNDQAAEVHCVLWAIGRQCQEFHRNEVLGQGDGHGQTGRKLQPFSVLANLRLDAGRGEQQVNDNALLVLPRGHDPDGGPTAQRMLLEGQLQGEAGGHQFADQKFRSGIVGHGHSNINVSGEAGFDPHRHRESTDQRPGLASRIEKRRRAPERGE